MFINNWRRNYTDIYQPTFIYSTEEEKDESDQNLAQSKWRFIDSLTQFRLISSLAMGTRRC